MLTVLRVMVSVRSECAVLRVMVSVRSECADCVEGSGECEE